MEGPMLREGFDPPRACRVCGCTQNRACCGPETACQPCHWVGPDLCSACSFGGPAAPLGAGPDDAFDPDLEAGFDPIAGDLS